MFKVALEKRPNLDQKLINCALSLERVSGFYPNLDKMNIHTWHHDKDFGTMTRIIFKVTLEKMLGLGKTYLIFESADVSKFTKFV